MASGLDSLEHQLNELFVTKSPVQIPENWRKWLATYAWVFALIGFIFGLLSIFVLLPALGLVSTIGIAAGVGGYLFFAWLALAVLVGYVILLGMAIPRLKALKKSGWNLIFYSSLFFLCYDVFNALRYLSVGSIFGLVWNLIGTAVGLYFLFQVRSYFVGKKKAAEAKPAKAKS